MTSLQRWGEKILSLFLLYSLLGLSHECQTRKDISFIAAVQCLTYLILEEEQLVYCSEDGVPSVARGFQVLLVIQSGHCLLTQARTK